MNTLRQIFYPVGKYHKNYRKYIGYSFISNLVASTQQTLSVHNILAVMGNEDTTRTMNYITKDVIGQLGSLGYMAKMAKNADKNPKKFLLYSNVAQQSALLMSCTATPEWFLTMVGGANILANISFAGFGAINAKCISILSEDNNIGEIYAKVTVINTVGSSLGMLLGVGIMKICGDCYSVFVPILGVIRIYTFNKAIEGLTD